MNDVNWWLMTLAFLIGLALTLGLMVRRVTREVPITHSVSAGIGGKVDGPGLDIKAPDLGKIAGGVTAAGAAVLSGAADKVGAAADAVADKIEGLLERDPHGAGSVRLGARKDAPAGYTVKFDAVSKRYLAPGMVGYEELETEYWFADEASAKAAGFSRWDDFKDKVGDLVDRIGDKVGAAADAVGDKVGAAADAVGDKLSAAADDVDAKAAGVAGLVSGAAAGVRASIDDIPPGPHGKGSAKAAADGSGPAGWLIKGNADSMLFHGPDSPAYEQTIAEVWFFDEESARKAGFDKWDKNFR